MTQFNSSTSNSLIDKIKENGLCTGCGLCAAVAPVGAITIQLNASGYLRPMVHQPLSGETEQQIKAACPALVIKHAPQVSGQHPLWGPLQSVRTAYSSDAEIRRQGSSGGVISALADYLISSGKVDFVAQVATSTHDPLANELQISRSREDVIRAAGSRYAPSAPLQSLRALLDSGQRFAFVGKPCDVAALRQYARINPQVDRQVPYMLSFMCAGVPSIKGTHEVIRKLSSSPEKVVSFRYRGDGWPGMTRAVQADGQVFEMDYNSSWGTILNKHLQFRCKICPDGTGEFADVVCADAWYGKDGYPDFTERDGRSLLLARTAAGEALVREVMQREVIVASDLAVEEIAKMQPYQVDRKRMVLGRVIATRLARGVAPHYSRLGLVKASLAAKPVVWLKSAWGTWRRAKGEAQ
ncbi:Coenzyme F420 hydrogenase/dehydrogenase, beta subunit C-terminal domain [Duganella sp. sic0402]|uniref:Coenzyme F420 hydrogenase/dehydrogenase, beta subunit C-terminal domain n=1 Tax=Duganella sp. sic0402 TaxID=2854786 RepID=UPI001C45C727|nr:Coenzyme F420 hydrogenase/dehydrogenase, beta subunit C-terminal domain [Duganella sp. sic0402]MBV7535971.1 Coenzyme F420 hydrogenase/dehydrogenase, beta subunit C-terminal domain [Duganella sp. sic0402]